MEGSRERLMVAIAAVLFGVAFGILVLACGQPGDQPEAKTEAPTSANARTDAPPPAAARKAAETRETRGFADFHSHVQDLGVQLEGLRAKATGESEVALEELEAEQARLMAELDAIGGQNEKWDAARAELIPKIIVLRKQIRELREKTAG
jgi:hypothetical protein